MLKKNLQEHCLVNGDLSINWKDILMQECSIFFTLRDGGIGGLEEDDEKRKKSSARA